MVVPDFAKLNAFVHVAALAPRYQNNGTINIDQDATLFPWKERGVVEMLLFLFKPQSCAN